MRTVREVRQSCAALDFEMTHIVHAHAPEVEPDADLGSMDELQRRS